MLLFQKSVPFKLQIKHMLYDFNARAQLHPIEKWPGTIVELKFTDMVEILVSRCKEPDFWTHFLVQKRKAGGGWINPLRKGEWFEAGAVKNITSNSSSMTCVYPNDYFLPHSMSTGANSKKFRLFGKLTLIWWSFKTGAFLGEVSFKALFLLGQPSFDPKRVPSFAPPGPRI